LFEAGGLFLHMEFRQVVETRHSVRTYLKKAVEDEKLQYVLDCARLAPSFRNGQCWRFVVVRDPELRKKVATTSLLNRWMYSVPIILVACADPSESGNRNGIDYFGVDVGIAFEHVVLAAADVGLGTCWMAAFNEEQVRDTLGIPRNIRVVALSPLGYPAKRSSLFGKTISVVARSKHRRPLDQTVHYDRW